jgi:hypothetical protein
LYYKVKTKSNYISILNKKQALAILSKNIGRKRVRELGFECGNLEYKNAKKRCIEELPIKETKKRK